jgi:hypothetical protein
MIRLSYSLLTIEVKLLFSHRDWEKGVMSFLTIIFQSQGSQVLEKDFLAFGRFTIQRNRKTFSFKFSKVVFWEK